MSATNATPAAAIPLESKPASKGVARESPDIRVAPGPPDADTEPKAQEPSSPVAQWLDWQCRMISGVNHGAVFLIRKAGYGGFRPAASWPEQNVDSANLRSAAEQAIAKGAQVAQKEVADVGVQAEVSDIVAFPLLDNDRVVGAVALSMAIRSESQRQAVQQLLQWGTVWLENAVNNQVVERRDGSVLALEAIGLVSRDLPLAVVCHDLCNFLADRFDCSRVALGTWSGLQVRVLSMSHQLQFDRRVSHVEQIEFAMEECVDQRRKITVPASDTEESVPKQAHVQLLQQGGDGAACSFPLIVDEESLGALTLLSTDKRGFDEATVELIAQIAKRLAPLIHLKQREARSGWRKMAQTLGGGAGSLLGAGHLRLKFFVAAAVVSLGLLTLIQADHRVAADSTIEGALQQAVVAPFASYLRSASVRAGDTVDEGQVLAVLDDRDLLLEQEKLNSERDKHTKEYQQALAVRDRAKASIMSARVDQTRAQLRLVEQQLQRTKLRAPFAGVVVSGDLSRALGAPVERGQLLFEIVPQEGYHVMLKVDEHDVAGLRLDQPASLRLAGMPDQSIPIRISRIFPVASAENGGNHFRVEGELQEVPVGLRPGMHGVAKVVVGRASLLTVWTSSLVDRLRLWAWSLGF